MKNILCGVSPQCCGPWSHNTVGRVPITLWDPIPQ